MPASVVMTGIARPVAEVSAAATQPLFCMRAGFRLMVDRSAIRLAARAVGLYRACGGDEAGKNLQLRLGQSHPLQCLLV
jgi:hypothetical protein